MKQATQDIINKKELTEKEIHLLCLRANKGEAISMGDSYRLTPAQTQKGLDWLLNLWKTPRGVERKNNPFGYREQDVLEHVGHFTFDGLYDAGNSFAGPHYMPIYSVHATDGGFFQYVAQNGTVLIIG